MLAWLQDLALSALNRLAADTACRVGGGLGVLAWRLGIRRRIASANLTRCLGLRGPERARVLRRSYATMGADFLEIWTVGGPAGPERSDIILNPRWQRLVELRHRSMVFVSPHVGCWESGAHLLSCNQRPVAVYAKAQHNPALDARLQEQRGKNGVRVVLLKPGDHTGAVQALRLLRQGGILAMLADQKPHGGTPAWLLGIATRCHEGPAFFARKAKVAIVPGLAVRRRAGVNLCLIGRPLPLGRDHASDVQTTMDMISAMVAAFPGQYFWQHRRFPDEAIDLPRRASEPWRTQGLRLITANVAPTSVGTAGGLQSAVH